MFPTIKMVNFWVDPIASVAPSAKVGGCPHAVQELLSFGGGQVALAIGVITWTPNDPYVGGS